MYFIIFALKCIHRLRKRYTNKNSSITFSFFFVRLEDKNKNLGRFSSDGKDKINGIDGKNQY